MPISASRWRRATCRRRSRWSIPSRTSRKRWPTLSAASAAARSWSPRTGPGKGRGGRVSRGTRPAPRFLQALWIVDLPIVILVVIVVTIALADLAADLTRREPGHRMDIGIGGIRFQRVHERVEVAGGDILSCRAYYARVREGAGHGPGIGRAYGRPGNRGGGEGRGRAEPHHDAAGHMPLTEMDMCLRHGAGLQWRCAHVRIGQGEGCRAGVFVQAETQSAAAVAQNRAAFVVLRSDLLEPVQACKKFLRVSVASRESDQSGDQHGLDELVQAHGVLPYG